MVGLDAYLSMPCRYSLHIIIIILFACIQHITQDSGPEPALMFEVPNLCLPKLVWRLCRTILQYMCCNSAWTRIPVRQIGFGRLQQSGRNPCLLVHVRHQPGHGSAEEPISFVPYKEGCYQLNKRFLFSLLHGISGLGRKKHNTGGDADSRSNLFSIQLVVLNCGC